MLLCNEVLQGQAPLLLRWWDAFVTLHAQCSLEGWRQKDDAKDLRDANNTSNVERPSPTIPPPPQHISDDNGKTRDSSLARLKDGSTLVVFTNPFGLGQQFPLHRTNSTGTAH